MSVVWKEIKRIDQSAAYRLERLKFCTDSDLKSLTREDLRELFPGESNLRMRKSIFEAIHKQQPIGLVLNEMKDFIPDESLRAALSNTGVLVDYLHILKDMKAQMNNVQTFLDAHISLLEDIKKSQSDKKPDEGGAEVTKHYFPDPKYSTSSLLSSSSSRVPAEIQKLPTEDSEYSSSWWSSASSNVKTETQKPPPEDSNPWWGSSSSNVKTETQKPPPEDPPQSSQFDSPGPRRANTGGPVVSVNPTGFSPQTRKTIKYKMEISGNTLNAHMQILDRVQIQDSSSVSLNLLEGSDLDSDITLLFCPIASRTGTDVETAMKKVKGDKRVILVLMRHSHEAKAVTSKRTWSDFPHVVLHVIVFYHDTVKGLLSCPENNDAISEIRKELLKHSYETPEESVVPQWGNRSTFPSEPAHNFGRSNGQKKNSGFFLRSIWQ